MKKILVLAIIFPLLIPISYSNGGCIKIADDIFVQLSISPLVPIADKQASFLISFGNKEGLIKEEINGEIWIAKDGEKIFTKDFKIKDGILDLKYIFKKEGLYEIFLEFDYKNKTYTPEDFLIEVKEESNASELGDERARGELSHLTRTRSQLTSDFVINILFLIIGIFIGIALMKFIKK